MNTRELKVTRIGNSRGVRLPAATLRRYHVGSVLLMEERSDAIVLRPAGSSVEKLSWVDTAREMAASGENWSAWDTTASDGMEAIPWETPSRAVAESPAPYNVKPRSKRSAKPRAKAP
jgi:antitoxin component of MazEF toxin-antitoxin module